LYLKLTLQLILHKYRTLRISCRYNT